MTNRHADAHRWRLGGVLIMGAVLSILDATIVSVGIGSIAHDLDSSITTVSSNPSAQRTVGPSVAKGPSAQRVTGRVRSPRMTNSGRRSGVDARRRPGSREVRAVSAAAISTRASGAPMQ